MFGHPTIETPNLDQMAAEGMRFTQMYTAAPLCSPSRAALLTGRLPVRNGAYRNESSLGYAFGVDAVFSGDALGGLALSEVTIADALKRKGYKTKMIGRHYRTVTKIHGSPAATVFHLQLVFPENNRKCTL